MEEKVRTKVDFSHFNIHYVQKIIFECNFNVANKNVTHSKSKFISFYNLIGQRGFGYK